MKKDPQQVTGLGRGKKQLTGRTGIAFELRNPCARLIASAISQHTSVTLSALLTNYKASGNAKALTLLKKVAPRPPEGA